MSAFIIFYYIENLIPRNQLHNITTVNYLSFLSLVGIKGGSSNYFKYVKLQDKIVTTKEYESAKKKWLKEKEISNKKAQDNYENHVK